MIAPVTYDTPAAAIAQQQQHATDADYAQMLVAAGWIDAAALDDDYLDYCRKAPHCADGDTMPYGQWTSMKREWDRLNERYIAEVEPHQWGEKSAVDKLAEQLLRDMSWIEVSLGY